MYSNKTYRTIAPKPPAPVSNPYHPGRQHDEYAPQAQMASMDLADDLSGYPRDYSLSYPAGNAPAHSPDDSSMAEFTGRQVQQQNLQWGLHQQAIDPYLQQHALPQNTQQQNPAQYNQQYSGQLPQQQFANPYHGHLPQPYHQTQPGFSFNSQPPLQYHYPSPEQQGGRHQSGQQLTMAPKKPQTSGDYPQARPQERRRSQRNPQSRHPSQPSHPSKPGPQKPSKKPATKPSARDRCKAQHRDPAKRDEVIFKPAWNMLDDEDLDTIKTWASVDYKDDVAGFIDRVHQAYPLPPRPSSMLAPEGRRNSSLNSDGKATQNSRSGFWTKAEIAILVYEVEFGLFSKEFGLFTKPALTGQPKTKTEDVETGDKKFRLGSWITKRLAQWGFSERGWSGIDSMKSRFCKNIAPHNKSWLLSNAEGDFVAFARALVEDGVDISPVPGAHPGMLIPKERLEDPIKANEALHWGLPVTGTYKGKVAALAPADEDEEDDEDEEEDDDEDEEEDDDGEDDEDEEEDGDEDEADD